MNTTILVRGLILGCLLLTIVAQTNAATYYVSPSGSDSNNGLSETTPLKTIAKAGYKVVPGDTVLLQGGAVWKEMVAFYTNGTAAAPISISTYGSGFATLDGSGATGYAGINATRAYQNYSNLEIRNQKAGRSSVYVAGATYNTFDNVYIHDSYVGFHSTDSAVSSGNVVRNSRLENFDNQAGGGYAVLVGTNAKGWKMENTTISNAKDSCIIDRGLGSSYDQMNISNCGFSTLSYGTHGIYLKGPNQNISNSIVSNSRDSCVSTRYHGAMVFHNVLSDCSVGISYFDETSNTGSVSYSRNLIKDVKTGIYLDDSKVQTFNISNNTILGEQGVNAHTGYSFHFENNIFTSYTATGTNIPFTINGYTNSYSENNNVLYSYNPFYTYPVIGWGGRWVDFATYKTQSGQGNGTLDIDPLLNTDGTLSAGSPAINAGTTSTSNGYIVDYMGSAPDMGYNEFVE